MIELSDPTAWIVKEPTPMNHLGRTMLSDIHRFSSQAHGPVAIVKAAIANPGYGATVVFRFVEACHERGWRKGAMIFRQLGITLYGADFVPGARAGHGLKILHPQGIVIGKDVRIGRNCTLLQAVTIGERHVDGLSDGRYPRIGDGVSIGAGAMILGNVRVGNNAAIGAGSVVLADVVDGGVAVGVPARVVSVRSGPLT